MCEDGERPGSPSCGATRAPRDSTQDFRTCSTATSHACARLDARPQPCVAVDRTAPPLWLGCRATHAHSSTRQHTTRRLSLTARLSPLASRSHPVSGPNRHANLRVRVPRHSNVVPVPRPQLCRSCEAREATLPRSSPLSRPPLNSQSTCWRSGFSARAASSSPPRPRQSCYASR